MIPTIGWFPKKRFLIPKKSYFFSDFLGIKSEISQNDSSFCESLTARVSNPSFDKFNLHHNWEYKKRHIAIKMHSSLHVSCSLKLIATSIKI